MRGVLPILLGAVLTAWSAGTGGRVAAAPPPGAVAQDLPELVQAASLVVVGRVVEVRAGRSAGSGEGRLQFNDVHISVERRLKGNPPATIVVEQVAPAGRVVSSEVGPPYEPGERDVLFMREGEGHRHVVFPQGRYRLGRGPAHPIGPGPRAEGAPDLAQARLVGEDQARAHGNAP